MIYVCDNCRFVFERMGEVSGCPVCTSSHVRPANEAEQQTYQTEKQARQPQPAK